MEWERRKGVRKKEAKRENGNESRGRGWNSEAGDD